MASALDRLAYRTAQRLRVSWYSGQKWLSSRLTESIAASPELRERLPDRARLLADLLGITPVDADATAKAAKLAGAASRFNTMFSIPMLLCMAAQSHLG